jgi:hypothetical protein
MARRLRLQYPGAIYHLMARGNRRREIMRDDADRDRLQEQVGKAAIRCSWRVYAFAIMSNHRAESVPNLMRRFSDWLSTDAKIRKQFTDLEAEVQRA